MNSPQRMNSDAISRPLQASSRGTCKIGNGVRRCGMLLWKVRPVLAEKAVSQDISIDFFGKAFSKDSCSKWRRPDRPGVLERARVCLPDKRSVRARSARCERKLREFQARLSESLQLPRQRHRSPHQGGMISGGARSAARSRYG